MSKDVEEHEEEVGQNGEKSGSVYDTMMADEAHPKDSDEWLSTTQKLRIGLVKKHLKDTDDPAMLGRVDSLLNNIDKQELTKQRMAQDKEEGQANREIANELFQSMLNNQLVPKGGEAEEVAIEESGFEMLDDELIQGDDTTNSVID